MRCWFHFTFMAAVAILLLLPAACAPHSVVMGPAIRDVAELPQDLEPFAARIGADSRLVPKARQGALYNHYLEKRFGPWSWGVTHRGPDKIFWGLRKYRDRLGYGENKRPRPPSWMAELVTMADPDRFPSQARRAITVRNTSLRLMPTIRPFFRDFALAGEGYPFDYFQESSVWAGTPVFVSHVSLDGAWFMTETSFAWGWVPADDLAWVDEEFVQAYSGKAHAALLRDETVLTGEDGRFRIRSHVGAVFPLSAQNAPDENGYRVLVPAADADRNAVLRTALLSRQDAVIMPLPLTAGNAAKVGNALMGRTYGWGGLYEDRDCSSTLKDMFTPFGLWLPRNSAQQAAYGTQTDISGLGSRPKEEAILARAKPFMTLLRKPGHIMLYVGEHDGRAVIFHNMWGVRTRDWLGRAGRRIVGKAVVTTLQPGRELWEYDSRGDILSHLLFMTTLGAPPVEEQQ